MIRVVFANLVLSLIHSGHLEELDWHVASVASCLVEPGSGEWDNDSEECPGDAGAELT